MTLSQEVYLKIKDDVNTLAIKSNEFLNEQQLAEKYGVSKAPIRAALHRLCSEGILVSYPRKGYMVATLNDADFRSVQQIRVINECYCLELVLRNATRQQLLELRSQIATSHTMKDNLDFHLVLARLSGNRYLYSLVEQTLHMVTRTVWSYLRSEERANFRESHLAILDALLTGDLALAKALMAADIQR